MSTPTTPTTRNTQAIGFVGIGIMGEGMAARLLSQGIAGSTIQSPLVIWNRTAQKCNDLKQQFPHLYIEIKASPKDVVESCGVTYCMLSTPEASRAVFDGDDGVLAGVGEGASIVDCATLAEADMQRMNEAVVSKGGYVFLFLFLGRNGVTLGRLYGVWECGTLRFIPSPDL